MTGNNIDANELSFRLRKEDIEASAPDWQGVGLRRYRHDTPGAASLPGLEKHWLIFHLAGPSVIDRDLDGGRKVGRSLPGRMTLVPAGCGGDWEWSEGMDVLHLYLDPTLFDRVAEEGGGLDPSKISLIDRFQITDPFVQQIGIQLLTEARRSGKLARIFSESAATLLALHLLRQHSTAGDVPDIDPGAIPPRIFKRVVDAIDARLSEDIALAELANIAGCSVGHFARAFKRSTGVSPMRFIQQRRIDLAAVLLQTTNLPIVEVALTCGFQNQAHFTTLFSRLRGLTPAVYRREFSNL